MIFTLTRTRRTQFYDAYTDDRGHHGRVVVHSAFWNPFGPRMECSRASVSSGSEPGGPDPGGQESLSGPEPVQNPWMSPLASAGEAEADGELQAFLAMRNKADKDTEEWEKLNYDIHTLRYARREVSTRWRKILLQLGYQREVESLMCVNRQSLRDLASVVQARELLQSLREHSSLFPRGVVPQDRYLFVMDRLVSLDSADDFIRLAKQKYPKKV